MQQKINMKIDTSAIEQEIANYEKQLRQSYATKSRLIDEIDTLDPDDNNLCNSTVQQFLIDLLLVFTLMTTGHSAVFAAIIEEILIFRAVRLVEQENYLLVDGLHEAIVSEGLWHEAQVKLLAQAKKYEKVN